MYMYIYLTRVDLPSPMYVNNTLRDYEKTYELDSIILRKIENLLRFSLV